MANLLIIGNTLVKPEEYLEKKQLGDIDKFTKSLQADKEHSIEFSTGAITTSGFFEKSHINEKALLFNSLN